MEPLAGSSARALLAARAHVLRAPTTPFVCAACTQIQTRGAKHKRRIHPKTITIKLLRDMPGYGRQGAIVPVTIGQMRNWLHPKHIAEYVSSDTLRDLKRQGVTLERDTLFGTDQAPRDPEEVLDEEVEAMPEPGEINLKNLGPEQAHKLLDTLVPPTFIYRRAPIANAEQRRRAATPTDPAHVAAPPPQETPRQSADNIYGSVTAADVTSSIRALLQQRGLTGVVVLPDEDVRFVELGGPGSEATAQRLKSLGEFAYEIQVKGASGKIKRTVRVVPDDEDPRPEGPDYEGAGVAVPGQVVEERADAVTA